MIIMIEETYKKYFYYCLNQILKIKELDDKISNSNLYFGVSNMYTKDCESMFNTKFIRCLNKLYVDKLSEEEKNMLLNGSEEEKIEVIRKTYKKVIEKDKVKYITYEFTIPERIIKNPSIVLEIVYGKNTKKFDTDGYIENMHKQEKLIKEIIEKLEEEIKEKLGVLGKVVIQRAV